MITIRSRKRITPETKFLKVNAATIAGRDGQGILSWASGVHRWGHLFIEMRLHPDGDKLEIEFQKNRDLVLYEMRADFRVKRLPAQRLMPTRYLLTVYFDKPAQAQTP